MSSTDRVIVHEGEGGAAFGPVKTYDVETVETVSGSHIPRYGFGTFKLEGDTARSLTAEALMSGIRHIDTAQMYGNESDVGQGIIDSGIDRDEIFLTTKVNNDRHEPDELVRSVDESLKKLGTDYVDLLLIHWPVEWDRIGATLSQLAQIQAGGLARQIGVSNFTIAQLEIAAEFAPLEVLQVECHPFFQQRELRDWCNNHGWAFTAYSPLGQGKVFDDETLESIAREQGVKASAVALAWLMSKPGVNVIPRTSSVEHLHDNNEARTLDLTPVQLELIDTLDSDERLIDPDFGPWNQEKWQ